MFLDGLLSILAAKTEYQIILTANNGKNVAKYIDINSGKEPIDLVITDVNMPEYDGIALNKFGTSFSPPGFRRDGQNVSSGMSSEISSGDQAAGLFVWVSLFRA